MNESKPIALIPAYVPEPAIIDITAQLAESGVFSCIIVVDDGSGDDSRDIFQRLLAIDHVLLLSHHTNLGKGMALKTGLNYVGCHFPDSVGVVTLDADGQHRVADVLNVANALVDDRNKLIMGCREFPSSIPLRSRFGNILTRHVMKLFGGLSLSDTQTGLRGIPMHLFPELLRLGTMGYDYELDMLLHVKKNKTSIIEIPIETVYIDENSSSHFNPLVDSLKIYLVFLRFNISSLISVLIDYSVFSFSIALGYPLLASQCAGSINYFLNRHFVFRSDRSHAFAMTLYITILIGMGLCSYGLILVMSESMGVNIFLAKVISELLLYFASFALQRDFVFTRKEVE